ncbi:MAG: hypothetical protein V4724_23530 [Pseudomonadota bacterium]
MNNDLYKGILIMVVLVTTLVIGAIALTDHGWQKAGCVGRAIGSGISFGNISDVCGLRA